MNARERILAAVRAARPDGPPLPETAAIAAGFPRPDGDPAARFVETATAAGTRVLHAAPGELAAVVAAAHPDAERVLSRISGVPGTVAVPGTPHELADLEVLACEAVLGVAENGAVWLPESRAGLRGALFLALHVVVVLDRGAIVEDLHQAYARIDPAAEGFGAFVAGPSKTADIEQSLVVGAHGPKSLTVVLTGANGGAPDRTETGSEPA